MRRPGYEANSWPVYMYRPYPWPYDSISLMLALGDPLRRGFPSCCIREIPSEGDCRPGQLRNKNLITRMLAVG